VDLNARTKNYDACMYDGDRSHNFCVYILILYNIGIKVLSFIAWSQMQLHLWCNENNGIMRYMLQNVEWVMFGPIS